MARFEFEYTEIDGLLYPNIEIDRKAILDGLGKYGRLRLNFLREQKPQMYRDCFLRVNWQNIAPKLKKLHLKCQKRFALVF